jgi:peptide/nickel transport system substrate-binding protein
MLSLVGMGGAGMLAGCTGGDGGTATPTEDEGTPTESPTPTATPTPTQEYQMGGELIATFGADVANFDPTRINDTTSSKAFGLVYEGLMSTGWTGTPRLQLAESLEQVGDLTFKAKLREGVEFHNGKELTAEDVQASMERYEGTPREADVYQWYESSTIQNDYEIDLKLSRVFAPFKFNVGVPIVPSEVADGEIDLTEDPVGTGPYVFDEHRPDELFRLQRNENYWFTGNDVMPEKPPIETLTFRVIVEQSAQMGALQAGNVDIINAVPAANYQDLTRDDNPFEVGERTAGGFDMFIYPLHETADTPWQNRKVRLGTNRLIPREAIVEAVYHGIGIPAYSPISPLAGAFTSEEFNQEMGDEYAAYDTEEATSLLQEGFDEAGFDKPFESTIITNENPQRVQWAQLIQEQMNNTEFFDIELNQFEWNTYVGKILSDTSHEQNQLTAVGWSAGFDPDSYVNFLFHSGKFTPACCNINHYSNEEVDDLIDSALETFDLEERQQLYEEVQRTIVQESPMAFIRFGKRMNAWWKDKVRNFATYPIDSGEYDGIYAPYGNKFTWVNK